MYGILMPSMLESRQDSRSALPWKNEHSIVGRQIELSVIGREMVIVAGDHHPLHFTEPDGERFNAHHLHNV